MPLNRYSLCQLLVVLLLVYFFRGGSFLLIQILTSDSLFQAIDVVFQRYHWPHGPQITWFDKYCFYGLLTFGFYLLDALTYQYLTIVWSISALVLTCPSILATMLRIAEIQQIVEGFNQKKRDLCHQMLCSSLSKIINGLCQTNLGTNPRISRSELSQVIVFENTEYIWKFIKIFLVNSLVRYMETHSSSYYTSIVRFLYRYGHLIELPQTRGSMLESDPDGPKLSSKEVLRKVVQYRRWTDLYDPQVLNHLVELYAENQNNYLNQLLERLSEQLQVRSLKFGAILTICGLSENYLPANYLFPLVSIALNYGQFFNWDAWTKWPQNWELGLKIITYTTAVLTSYWGVWAALSEFLPLALNRRLVGLLCHWFYENWRQLRLVLVHQNQYNYHLLAGWLYLMAIKYLIQDWRVRIIMMAGLPLIAQYAFIYSWLLGWGLFSNYHPVHLTFLAAVLYLGVNLKDYQNAPEPGLDLDLMHSYYPNDAKKTSKKPVLERPSYYNLNRPNRANNPTKVIASYMPAADKRHVM